MSRANVVRAAERYEFTDANEQLRLSALAMLRQVVGMNDVLPRHHNEQISLALWKWTEAFGLAPNAKYNLRFVSRGVMESAPDVPVNHEHVFPRKWLVRRLLTIDPASSDFETFLDDHGVACVVTVEEHAALGAATGTGWMRYVAAGVDVYDRAIQQYVEPATLMPGGGGDLDSALPPATNEETTVSPAAMEEWDVVEFILRNADQRLAVPLLRLARSAELAMGVTAPQRTSNKPAYFRVHDTLVEEPTRAAAYVNLNGNIDLALDYDELPQTLRDLEWVVRRKSGQKPYEVRCVVSDEQSVAMAEDLLVLALTRIRDEYASWPAS